MYIYTYICIYVCIYLCIYIYIHIYVSVSVRKYVGLNSSAEPNAARAEVPAVWGAGRYGGGARCEEQALGRSGPNMQPVTMRFT